MLTPISHYEPLTLTMRVEDGCSTFGKKLKEAVALKNPRLFKENFIFMDSLLKPLPPSEKGGIVILQASLGSFQSLEAEEATHIQVLRASNVIYYGEPFASTKYDERMRKARDVWGVMQKAAEKEPKPFFYFPAPGAESERDLDGDITMKEKPVEEEKEDLRAEEEEVEEGGGVELVEEGGGEMQGVEEEEKEKEKEDVPMENTSYDVIDFQEHGEKEKEKDGEDVAMANNSFEKDALDTSSADDVSSEEVLDLRTSSVSPPLRRSSRIREAKESKKAATVKPEPPPPRRSKRTCVIKKKSVEETKVKEKEKASKVSQKPGKEKKNYDHLLSPGRRVHRNKRDKVPTRTPARFEGKVSRVYVLFSFSSFIVFYAPPHRYQAKGQSTKASKFLAPCQKRHSEF